MNTKKFTILHNNDIHGDFLSEVKSGKEGKLIGGLAFLSGYINKVRKEEENTKFYKICIQKVLEEWFRNHQNETRKIEGRITYTK